MLACSIFQKKNYFALEETESRDDDENPLQSLAFLRFLLAEE